MNEQFTKCVNISSRRPVIFDTRVVAIFGGTAEFFQKVPTLAGLKTGKIRTSDGRIFTKGYDRPQTEHPRPPSCLQGVGRGCVVRDVRKHVGTCHCRGDWGGDICTMWRANGPSYSALWSSTFSSFVLPLSVHVPMRLKSLRASEKEPVVFPSTVSVRSMTPSSLVPERVIQPCSDL